ncbi:MAG: peptidylprolyl isomerase [Calditrichia bacterium]
MSIEANSVVTMHYDLKNENGDLIESTKNHQPIAFLTGHQQILPKLEEKISQSNVGDTFQITLAPADAYGEFLPEYVKEVSRSDFPPDTEIEPGMDFVATIDNQEMMFFVKEVEGDKVVIDFNHPLAGETLVFDVEIVESRPATPEELSHGHVHGPGGHHH